MKKIRTFTLFFFLCMGTLFAQTPGAFNYQAVLRNNKGLVISSQDVTIRISILQQNTDGDIVFQETHSTSTNEFGLIVLEIGNGTPINGVLSDINWGLNSHFLKVEMDASGGDNFAEMGTSQMLSVPYALYAKSSGSNFSGNYADLKDTPTLPTDISQLSDEEKIIFDGNYNNLSNLPDISELATGTTEGWDKDVSDDFDGKFENLTNIPANLDTDATDDFDGDYNSLANKPTTISAAQATAIEANTSKISNEKADWNAASGEAQILNKPELTVFVETANTTAWDKNAADDFDGKFESLTNVPANLDTDATDDFDGDYNSLANTPTTISATQATAIETNTSKTSNVKGDWNAASGEAQILNKPDLTVYVETANTTVWDKNAADDFDGKFESLTNVPANLDTDATDDFDGDYNSLANTPTTISATQATAIETNTSKTSNVKGDWNAASGEAQILNKPDLTVFVETANTTAWDKNAADDFDGKFESLTNVPANLDTDATDDFDGDYNSLANTPTTISAAQATAIEANTSKISNEKADWNAASGEAQILNKPDLTVYVETANTTAWDKNATDDFDGKFESLTNVPANLDTDATDDFDGDYNSLSNLPTWSDSADVSINSVVGQYSVTDDDGYDVILEDRSGGGEGVILPSAYTNEGRVLTIKNVGEASIRVITYGMGTENIDGSFDYTLASKYESVKVVSDGTNWHIIGEKKSDPDLSAYVQSDNTAAWDKDATDDFDGNYNSLANKPTTISAAQVTAIETNTLKISNVKADWDAASGEAQILNKPDLTSGTDGQYLTSDGVGGTAWTTISKNASIKNVSGTYTVLDDDGYDVFLGASGMIYLPNAANNEGRIITVKNPSASIFPIYVPMGLIMADGNEIDGIDYFELAQYESKKIISDGTNWHIISEKSNGHNILTDHDGGTKIQVAETHNEDQIRFDLGGTEKWVMVGSRLESVGSGSSVFIGDDAGAVDDLGNNSTFIGALAGSKNTWGEFNTAIGYSALKENIKGHANAVLGYGALTANTEGDDNSVVGHNAMAANTTGSENTAVGQEALTSNLIGGRNTAVGKTALNKNTGDDNTAVGANSLYANTTGINNVAMGVFAGYNNYGGDNNIGIGVKANFYATNGSNNIGIGTGVLTNNISGNNNVAIGFEAGKGSGQHNISGSIFLGYQAGYSETGDNKLYIENSNSTTPLIYGEFDNDLLVINGQLTINNGTDTEYTLPANRGTVGQVLKTNGAGVTSWTDGFDGDYSSLNNKPDLNNYVTTASTANWDTDESDDFNGDYNNLTNKPTTITSAQAGAIVANSTKVSNVQADWNATSGLAEILNKPDLSDMHDHAGIGAQSFVGISGTGNTATAINSTVVGGSSNTASHEYSFVGGGTENTSGGIKSITGGGEKNSSSGNFSFLGGGSSNQANGVLSSIVGGLSNKVNSGALKSTIAGGSQNTADGEHVAIGGGNANHGVGNYSTIAGGSGNVTNGIWSTATGGSNNTASGKYSTVSGFNNIANSYGETAIGLFNNDVAGSEDTYEETDQLFVIGNGTAVDARSDALVMLKNGNTTLNGKLTINNGTDTEFTLPANRGTIGQVITSDGSGGTSWAAGSTTHSIGDSYGGGIIFWLDESGQHGLIGATADQSEAAKWGDFPPPIVLTNAVRDGIGAGMYNTERIIANQGAGTYAAQICANYQGSGYGDWYLPSKYELNLLYEKRSYFGGFPTMYYWSSTIENDSSTAWRQEFINGDQEPAGIPGLYNVRAIRSF